MTSTEVAIAVFVLRPRPVGRRLPSARVRRGVLCASPVPRPLRAVGIDACVRIFMDADVAIMRIHSPSLVPRPFEGEGKGYRAS